MNERDILAQKDFAVKEALVKGRAERLAEGEARGEEKGRTEGLAEGEIKGKRYSGQSHTSYRLPPRSQQWRLSSWTPQSARKSSQLQLLVSNIQVWT